jgi:hypothetical protein
VIQWQHVDNMAPVTMELQRGYATTENLSSQGLRAGQPNRRKVVGGGQPHAVIRGQQESLCGKPMRMFADGVPGSLERLCPQCEGLLQDADWTRPGEQP